jgi:hypothetical protein
MSSATLQATTGITCGTLLVNGIDMTPNVGDIVTSVSFSAANNIVSAADVTKLAFPNANVRSYESIVAVSLTATSGNLYAQYRLYGLQKATGSWVMNSSFIGDNTGVVFSMSNTGQVQYTSTNIPAFVDNIMTFEARTLPI